MGKFHHAAHKSRITVLYWLRVRDKSFTGLGLTGTPQYILDNGGSVGPMGNSANIDSNRKASL